MDTRALGVLLLLIGQLGLKAGDFTGKLRTVEVRRHHLGLYHRFDFLLALGLDLLWLGRLSDDGCLGLEWLYFRHRLGRGRRRDLVDPAVLERRDFSGLGYCFLFQGAAALLVFLGEEVGLFRCHFAFEGCQGDFQGLADLRGRIQGEAHTQDQCQVQQRGQEQGKSEPIRRAHASAGVFGGKVGRKCHRVFGSHAAREDRQCARPR
ncbi:hypothetical protein D3C76_1187410 [compost metagenome]